MGTRPVIRIGHLRIADHLLLGVTADRVRKGELEFSAFELDAVAVSSWRDLADDLENDRLEGAFMPVPAAMSLFENGVALRLVMFVDRGRSLFVKNRNADIRCVREFKGKTVLTPDPFSVQHMLLHRLFSADGLTFGSEREGDPDVIAESFPSNVIAEILTNDPDRDIGGAVLFEPFAGRVIRSGACEVFLRTEDMWHAHPCCGFVLKDRVFDAFPQGAEILVNALVASGRMLAAEKAEEIRPYADAFLGKADGPAGDMLSEIRGMFAPSMVFPDRDALGKMQHYMTRHMGIMEKELDLETFVKAGYV